MNMPLLRCLSIALLFSLIVGSLSADELRLTVDPGSTDRAFSVVRVKLTKPVPAGAYQFGKDVGYVSGDELLLKLTDLKAGKSVELTGKPVTAKTGFAWHDTKGEANELRAGDRPVLRYMYTALDESTPEAREKTFKVYHHVFSPDGKTLLTKGPGGQFTHHRGIFFGFSKVSYGDDLKKLIDIWHCRGDAYQSHETVADSATADWFGGQTLKIDWHGVGKEVFATETRTVTAIDAPGGTLIEFFSTVTPKAGKVRFDGDPQHAGFHFRSSSEVNDVTKKQTYYLRTDGKGQPGETRNWDPKTKKGPVNLAWNAMSMVVGGNRYTIGYLDHPKNPKEARYSERDYGRFGSYFVAEATPEKPLQVKYRIWVQAGESTVDAISALSQDFVSPPKVTVK